VVKLGKWFGGIQGGPAVVVAAFGLFTLFSVPAAKLVCSWGCQLGALQESIFNIPLLRKKYRWHVPFWVSLGARLVLFGAFVVLLFGLGDFVVFHHVNYFKVFRPAELAPFAAATVGVMLLASFFVYRPFCQFVCPFGLWAWVLESVAPVKVRLDESKCIHCERCVRQCPTEAMKARYADKRGFFLPDCWSCGTCREVCPTDAITFEAARPGARTHTNETAEAGGSENSTSSGRH